MERQYFCQFLVLVSIVSSICGYAQGDKKDTLTRRCYSPYPDIFTMRLDPGEMGYWREALNEHEDLLNNGLVMSLVDYYLKKNYSKRKILNDFSTLLEEDFKTFGFYRNDKREGIWRVYFKNILLAQVIFVEDTILMVIGYKDGRIYAIERSKLQVIYFEGEYLNAMSEPAIKERIIFDRKGRIKEHIYVGEDGLLKRFLYCKGREIDGYNLNNSLNYKKMGLCRKVIRKEKVKKKLKDEK